MSQLMILRNCLMLLINNMIQFYKKMLNEHPNYLLFLGMFVLIICEFLFRVEKVGLLAVALYRFLLFELILFLLLSLKRVDFFLKLAIIAIIWIINVIIFVFQKSSYAQSLYSESYYLISAQITDKYHSTATRYTGNTWCSYSYNWNGNIEKITHYLISYEDFEKMIIGKSILVQRHSIGYCSKYKILPSENEVFYYSKPVLFVHNVEFGNDYYYYAKLRPDLALNNFGLNKLAIGKDNLLYYKNINDSIDSQIHQCADSLQSQLNRNMLDTEGAFYFHGEIIPAKQLFSEIPQAKEYYDKYNKK